MEIIKELPVEAATMLAPDADAREHWVVVVKATFTLPADSEIPVLAAQQEPLVYADEYLGEPGTTSLLAAYDFAPEKPAAEFLLTGSAFAPGGRPVTELVAQLEVEGLIRKAIRVVGDRTWAEGVMQDVVVTNPVPFTRMPLIYERAFGGMTLAADRQLVHRENLVGVGLSKGLERSAVLGKLLPNLENPRQCIRAVGEVTQTMCFAPLAPAWLPRASFAGTYDQTWLDERFPLLPTDFDARFFQSAPADQQVPQVRGGETVTLTNLTEEGHYAFRLPQLEMPVVLLFSDRADEPHHAKLDTVHINTDRRQLLMTWRLKVRRTGKPYALRKVVVGQMTERFWRRHHSPKPYYSSIAELIAAKAAR